MKILYAFISVAIAAAGLCANAGQPAPKYDTKLPIEISSDTLEVLQHENRAIFKGNVVAVQGQIRMKADVMIVHYKQKDQNAKTQQPAQAVVTPPAASAGAPGAPAEAGAMGAITLIETQGNVFVATPEESAKGDKGDYDVPTKTLHLFGSNVVLTRNKNILRGTALEYNFATGRSLLTNNNGTDVVKGGPAGRVRGVFVPEQTPKPGDKPAAAPVAPTSDPTSMPAPVVSAPEGKQ